MTHHAETMGGGGVAADYRAVIGDLRRRAKALTTMADELERVHGVADLPTLRPARPPKRAGVSGTDRVVLAAIAAGAERVPAIAKSAKVREHVARVSLMALALAKKIERIPGSWPRRWRVAK